MSAGEAGAGRLIATLSCAGLLSGVVLSGVFIATKPRIERNHAEALERAILKVVPGAAAFRAFAAQGERLTEAAEAAGDDESRVYAAFDAQGQPVGWAIPAQGPGFQDTIGLIYGFDPARRVIVGMAVLDSRETPGLGDKVASDAAFLGNFDALAVEPEIVPVTRGKKTRDNEVDCISGATISSKAVVRIIDESMRRWLPLLVGAAQPVANADAARETVRTGLADGEAGP